MNFFERVGRVWLAGRRDLHWHVLPTPAEADALAAPYDGFAPLAPGLQGVPPEGIPCTLLHAVGLHRDDVDLDALLKDVEDRARTVDPFTLTFDRPAIGAMAVEISGWPGSPFMRSPPRVRGGLRRWAPT